MHPRPTPTRLPRSGPRRRLCCSSLKYWRYSQSSRLARGAPRPSRCDARLSPRAARRRLTAAALLAPMTAACGRRWFPLHPNAAAALKTPARRGVSHRSNTSRYPARLPARDSCRGDGPRSIAIAGHRRVGAGPSPSVSEVTIPKPECVSSMSGPSRQIAHLAPSAFPA